MNQTNKKPRMHFANFARSQRLQQVHAFLKSRGTTGATTREILIYTTCVGVSTAIHELRMNGFKIKCEIDKRLSSSSRTVYRYTILNGGRRVRKAANRG